MRLIDADALKENIENWYALVNEWGQTGITLNHDDIIGKIDNQPTVDVLEQITAEIYEHFMTIDGGVHDASAIKCMEIIDKQMK